MNSPIATSTLPGLASPRLQTSNTSECFATSTANLQLLHEKLQGGWKATSPIRMYLPKASGLHRPLTLLALDDQIVLQAIAKQVAKQNYSKSRMIVRHVADILQKGVLHDYVQGKLWLIASHQARPGQTNFRFCCQLQSHKQSAAISQSRCNGVYASSSFPAGKLGLYSSFHAIKRVRSKSPYIQSLLVPFLMGEDYIKGCIAAELCQRPLPAPRMTLALEMVDRGLSLKQMGIATYRLSDEVKNVLRGLGLIGGAYKPRFDQIGEILRASYNLRPWRGWKALLGPNYQHALQLLLTAENKFHSDRSGWLASNPLLPLR